LFVRLVFCALLLLPDSPFWTTDAHSSREVSFSHEQFLSSFYHNSRRRLQHRADANKDRREEVATVVLERILFRRRREGLSDNDNNSKSGNDEIDVVASLLRRYGPNDAEHALDDALRKLSRAIVERRLRSKRLHAKRRQVEAEKSRQKVLLATLGSIERLRRVQDLVRQIEDIRYQRASLGCTRTECVLRTPQLIKTLPSSIPQPVRNLFFKRDRLLDVYKHASIEELQLLSRHKDKDLWSGLIEEAEQDVADYRAWSEGRYDNNDTMSNNGNSIEAVTAAVIPTATTISDDNHSETAVVEQD